MKLNLLFTLIVIFISISVLTAQGIKEFTIADSAVYPSFTVDKKGLIQTAWVYGADRKVYYGVFDDKGNVIVKPKRNEKSYWSSGTKIITNGDKKIIVWTDGAELTVFSTHIWGQQTDLYIDTPKATLRYNNSFGDAMRGFPFPIFMNDTTYYVLWSGDGPQANAIWGQKMTTTYKRLGDNILFSDSSNVVLSSKCKMPTLLNITSQNKYCVLWIDNRKSNYNIYARFFDYNDNPLTSSFRINDKEGAGENIWYYSAKLSATGEILIVWCDKIDGYWQLFLKKVGCNGSLITTSTQITSVSDYVADYPNIDLAVDDKSNIAVAWERYILSQPVKITIRLFDRSFNKIGEIKSISNDTLSTHQFIPQIQFIGENLYCMWYGKSVKMRIFSLGELTDVKENKNDCNENNLSAKVMQNYPNPFNPTTKISFAIPKGGNVKLKVFDVLGREVSVLADGFYDAGEHEVSFNAGSLPSGVYFYNLINGNNSLTKKMNLIR